MLRDLKRGDHQGRRSPSAKDGGDFEHPAIGGHHDRATSKN
jgi:hypothetical protein